MNVLIITPQAERWLCCADTFKQANAAPVFAASVHEAKDCYRRTPPALTLLDLPLSEEEQRAAVIELLTINAFIPMALVSELDTEQFHDRMEGLGLLGALKHPSPAELLPILEAWKALQ